MIGNLRVKPEERKLVTSWRNAAADQRTSCEGESRQGWNYAGDGGNALDDDHYQILIEHLRAKHGADRTRQETEQRKVMEYVDGQIDTLRGLAPDNVEKESPVEFQNWVSSNYSRFFTSGSGL